MVIGDDRRNGRLKLREARHDVDAAADLRYDAIPGVLHRIKDLEKRKREQLGASYMYMYSEDAEKTSEYWKLCNRSNRTLYEASSFEGFQMLYIEVFDDLLHSKG